MAFGDPKYVFLHAGCIATSAVTAHLLFGNYGGLSQHNNDEVVHVQIAPSAGDLRLGTSAVTNNLGLRLTTAASVFDLPPMRCGDASLLHVAPEGTNNACPIWVIWRRLP